MIKYEIKLHKQLSLLNGKLVYVLWKKVSGEHGYCTRGIYQGTKKECKEELKKIKEGE